MRGVTAVSVCDLTVGSLSAVWRVWEGRRPVAPGRGVAVQIYLVLRYGFSRRIPRGDFAARLPVNWSFITPYTIANNYQRMRGRDN